MNIDYESQIALSATIIEEGRESIIAVGSYARTPRTKHAEVAVGIRDDWQNQGLGAQLPNYLIENS